MPQTILEMAKDLVMAQIQSGGLSPEEMQKELQRTYANLAELKAKEDLGESGADLGGESDLDGDGAQSHVNWKKSIKKYTIECLICGAAFKQLSVRHLKEHGMDARTYRVRFGIPRTQPLSAKDTTATRKKIVQESRPWEKAPTYLKAQDRKTEEHEPVRITGKSRKQTVTPEV
ncbi:MAG: MucR family transcriptional regulator [Candidatus Tectimicrobiota bacterium]